MIEQDRKQLKSFVQELERIAEEKETLSEYAKAIFEQSKALGFHVKALRKVLADRRKDQDERRELEDMVDEYHAALGSFKDTPLGEAASRLAQDIKDDKLSVEINGETIGGKTLQ